MLDKINPSLYLKDIDVVPEAVLDASGWFETEYITVEYDAQDMTTNYVEWYMAQGWTVYNREEWGVVVSVSLGVPFTVMHYRVYLKRRKLQSERVLNDMIKEFTDAYNEGREVNDQRYDEIVTIYGVMLDKTQDDVRSLTTTTGAYNATIEGILALLPADFGALESDADGLLDDYGDSMRAALALRFDNESAKARSTLVSNGMYNTTVWTSVSTGIEGERAKALVVLEDQILERKLKLLELLSQARNHMRQGMLSAYERLNAANKDNVFRPLELRNSVLSAMLNFMERRQDDYPGLDGLANIAAQLGYSEGAAVVAPT